MTVVTITGNNDFARSSQLHALIDDFIKANGELSLERIDGEDAEFFRIQEALTSLPFLVNKKMVLLNRPGANAQFVEAAAQLLADLPETTDLVLHEPKFDKRSSLYKVLKKQTDYREYAELDGSQLANWLVARAKANGASLSVTDARYLIERVGHSQQLLANEVDKLSLFNSAINRQAIDLLTERTPQSTIFELIEAAFSGNRQRALLLYDEQRKLKVEPIQIVAMLAWQLHVLALVCAAEGRSAEAIASQSKQSPFTISKTQHLASKLSLTQARRLVDRLVGLDQLSKSGSIDLDGALRNYILQRHQA
jgi:DNA polymerase-3 subunit delta